VQTTPNNSIARLDKLVEHNLVADYFNRMFDCLLEYLTVSIRVYYVDLEWQGT